MAKKRKFQFADLVLIIICLASFLWLVKALLLGYYPDFNTQYLVPKILFSGMDPYSGGKGLYTPQVYPPTEFLFFMPLAVLPLHVMQYVYTFFSIVSLSISLYFLSKIFEIKFLSKINLILMSLVFVFFPAKFTLGMGQINFYILLLLVLFLRFLKQKKELLSGMILGLSFIIKLFPILIPFYFLIKLNKKILLGIFVSLLTAVLLVIIFIPFKIYAKFIFEILPTFLTSWKLDYYNQSLSGFIGRSFGTGQFASQLKFIFSILILLITFSSVILNRQKDFLALSLKIGILITANLLLNTFSWQHHFVWMIIPFYATVFYLLTNKRAVNDFIILAIGYVLVSLNFVNPKILPTVLQSHVFIGAVLIFLLQTKLLLDKNNRSVR